MLIGKGPIVGQCWLCEQRQTLQVGLCATCLTDLPRFPPRNLRPLERPDFCQVWLAALRYEAPVDRWLQAFKYRSTPALARIFAVLVAAHGLRFCQQTGELPQAVCAVPMSNARWRKRGFNQAWLLAHEVAKLLGLPCIDMLARVGGEHLQHELDWAARQANVERAFTCRRLECSFAHVVIIDDVITTGATFTHAARVLLEGGVAEQVSGWALAHPP